MKGNTKPQDPREPTIEMVGVSKDTATLLRKIKETSGVSLRKLVENAIKNDLPRLKEMYGVEF